MVAPTVAPSSSAGPLPSCNRSHIDLESGRVFDIVLTSWKSLYLKLPLQSTRMSAASKVLDQDPSYFTWAVIRRVVEVVEVLNGLGLRSPA